MQDPMTIPAPQSVLEHLWKKIPRYIRFTFAASFLLCLLIHHQAYSQSLLNLDNLGHLFGSEYGAASGRWLLPLVLKLDGNWAMSWAIGMIAAFFLSLSICVIVSLTRIRSTPGCLMAAALLVSFPAITSNHFYMFSAGAYMLSLFLACLGAYITAKKRWGLVPAILCIALSASIYQAYVSIAAALLVGVLIFELLDGKTAIPALVKRGFLYLASLGGGIALYYLLVKLTTRTTGLVDYMGISEMASLSVSDLLLGVVQAFGYYVKFFVFNEFAMHSGFALAAFGLMMAAALLLAVFLVRRNQLGWQKAALLAVALPVFLLAANIIKVMTPSAGQHSLMIYGFCLVPVAAIGLSEILFGQQLPARAASFVSGCGWIILAGALVLSLNYSLRANEVYFKSEQVEKQSVAYGNRLLNTIQQTEGYEAGMPVVLVGYTSARFNATPQLDGHFITGCFSTETLVRCYTYDLFLQRYCGWPDDIRIKPEELAPFEDLPAVQELEVYPGQGSTCIIDGVVVVRMS